MGLSLIYAAEVPKFLWTEAFHASIYNINRLPSDVLHGISPYKKLFESHPDYSMMRNFGSHAFVHLDESMRDKMS